MSADVVTSVATAVTAVVALVAGTVGAVRGGRLFLQSRQLSSGDWETLHLLTRGETNGLLSYSIQVDRDRPFGDDEDMPDRLDWPGSLTEPLRRLVAKGLLYEDPGSSRRKSSFRFTEKGQKFVRRNSEKLVNFYGEY